MRNDTPTNSVKIAPTEKTEGGADAEIAELRELVRAARHHIPRAWPQWGEWSAAARRALGPDFATSGSADYCPDAVDHEGVSA